MREEFNLLQGRGRGGEQILKRNKWTLRGRLEKENTWEFNIIFKGKTLGKCGSIFHCWRKREEGCGHVPRKMPGTTFHRRPKKDPMLG